MGGASCSFGLGGQTRRPVKLDRKGARKAKGVPGGRQESGRVRRRIVRLDSHHREGGRQECSPECDAMLAISPGPLNAIAPVGLALAADLDFAGVPLAYVRGTRRTG